MQAVRIIEIPSCRAVSSGIGMFGEEKIEKFDAWLSVQPRETYPRDFLFWDAKGEKSGFHWIYLAHEGTEIPAEFDSIDFAGGLYAVTTGIDQQTDEEAMQREVDRFLNENGFKRDSSRPSLGNVITSPAARKILGYDQMDYYTPIKPKP